MGEAAAFAWGAGTKQKSTHAGGKSDTNRLDIGFDVLDRIKNTEAVIDRTTGGIDVEENIFFRIFRLQKQQLRHHTICGLGGHGLTQKNDSLAQQARIDVKGTLSPTRLFDHDRDHGNHGGKFSPSYPGCLPPCLPPGRTPRPLGSNGSGGQPQLLGSAALWSLHSEGPSS